MVKEFEIPNVVNIESVDLVDLITKISEITLIDRITLIDEITKIGEITTIRDLMHRPKEYIINPHFMQGFTSWVKTGTVTLIDRTVKFDDLTLGDLSQYFPVPLKVDLFETMFFYLQSIYSDVDVLDVIYLYTDGTDSTDTFQVSSPLAEKKTLTPTAGKKIQKISFHHGALGRECYIWRIYTVEA